MLVRESVSVAEVEPEEEFASNLMRAYHEALAKNDLSILDRFEKSMDAIEKFYEEQKQALARQLDGGTLSRKEHRRLSLELLDATQEAYSSADASKLEEFQKKLSQKSDFLPKEG